MITDLSTPSTAWSRQLLLDASAISIDIETNPADNNRIFKVGAVRSDTEAAVSVSTGRMSAEEVARRIDAAAAGARLLVGHNLRRHDLPELRRQYPRLTALDLPVIDTLELSAIAFPTNPYHRLVKGYKLLSDSRNDPVKDARLALALLHDEIVALAAMQEDDPEWMSLLHFLLRGDAPLDRLLTRIRSTLAPAATEAAQLAGRRFQSICCDTRLGRFADADATRSHEHGLSLALALGWIRVSGGNSVLPIWVHKEIPEARALIGELREHDCQQSGCQYCRTQHDPESLLQAHFQWKAFRPKPAAADGSPLQRAIVVGGLERKSLLAVLPTGGGTSICYQLPALVHYTRAGN